MQAVMDCVQDSIIQLLLTTFMRPTIFITVHREKWQQIYQRDLRWATWRGERSGSINFVENLKIKNTLDF